MTEAERVIITNVANDVREIKTVLLGAPNSDDGGLVGQVNRHGKRLSTNERNFWLLVGFLSGAGILTGTAGIINLVS